MKKIADNNQAVGMCSGDGGNKTLKVFFIQILRHCYAVFAEMACFSQVKVTQDQCALLFPKYTAGGKKPKVLLMENMLYQASKIMRMWNSLILNSLVSGEITNPNFETIQ